MPQVLFLVSCYVGMLQSAVQIWLFLDCIACILDWVRQGLQDILLVCLLCRVSAVTTSGLLQHWVCMCSVVQVISEDRHRLLVHCEAAADISSCVFLC